VRTTHLTKVEEGECRLAQRRCLKQALVLIDKEGDFASKLCHQRLGIDQLVGPHGQAKSLRCPLHGLVEFYETEVIPT
jgi:hypothetical protein